MRVVVIGENGEVEATHSGDDFKEMLPTERQRAMYDYVAGLEVQAMEIIQNQETHAEAEPVNLMTVYVIGEDGQLEATHSGEDFRAMLPTERQTAMYDYVADLERQVNEQMASAEAAESAVNLHNIGQQYMASALDERAFENPFMEAYFQVKSEDLTMDDILIDITRMRQEREAATPSIADDFLGFGSFDPAGPSSDTASTDETDPTGLGALPFNLNQEEESSRYEVNVGFDTEIFGQQASQLFGNLVHEVKDDVQANVQDRPYSEQARIYAESQQTE